MSLYYYLHAHKNPQLQHMYVYMYIHMYAHTFMRVYTCTHIHMNKQKRTQTRKPSNTDTPHVQTNSPLSRISPPTIKHECPNYLHEYCPWNTNHQNEPRVLSYDSNVNAFTTSACLLDSQHIHNTYTTHPPILSKKHRAQVRRTDRRTDGRTQTDTHIFRQTDNWTSRVVCVIVREGALSSLLLPFVSFCLNSHHPHIQSAALRGHHIASTPFETIAKKHRDKEGSSSTCDQQVVASRELTFHDTQDASLLFSPLLYSSLLFSN